MSLAFKVSVLAIASGLFLSVGGTANAAEGARKFDCNVTQPNGSIAKYLLVQDNGTALFQLPPTNPTGTQLGDGMTFSHSGWWRATATGVVVELNRTVWIPHTPQASSLIKEFNLNEGSDDKNTVEHLISLNPTSWEGVYRFSTKKRSRPAMAISCTPQGESKALPTASASVAAPTPVAAAATTPPSTPSSSTAGIAPAPAPAAKATVAPVASVAAVLPATSKPSFDCGQAKTLIEELICKDHKLAAQDAQLSSAYQAASAAAADKGALRAAQLDWLKNKRNRCTSSECISAAYAERQAQLSSR